LIQLPPSKRFNIQEMESFFRILPTDFRYAVEFRHLSWLTDETWKLLKEYQIAYTIVDEPLLPPVEEITTDFTYFRWHGRGTRPWYNYRYKPEELSPWVPRLKDASQKTKRTYGFFNNHYHGYAVENCLQVLEMLGRLTLRQEQAMSKVQSHLRMRENTLTMPKITQFFPSTTEESIRQMLAGFLRPEKMKRMREILDNEISILQLTASRIEAAVRDYRIRIDLDSRQIVHNCADWNRCIPSKEFCKHIGKLMLCLPETESRRLLEDLTRNRDRWEFLPMAEHGN